MGTAAVKLYRDPAQARTAVRLLLQEGFKLDEVSVISNPQGAQKLGEDGSSFLAGVPLGKGALVGSGPVTQADSDNLPQVLQQALGINEDSFPYYEFGLVTGGVLVAVHSNGEKLAHARRLLREAEKVAIERSVSPGFDQATRMTSSNLIDAKMTGDFRRY